MRFTNNSSAKVTFSLDGATHTLAPQEFWEFTFGVAGDWHVVNNLNKDKGAVVHVR